MSTISTPHQELYSNACSFVASIDTVNHQQAIDSASQKIRLGLCCINNTLRKDNVFNSRTCTRKFFSVDKALDLSLKNVQDILPMLMWNEAHNIRHFRLSSDIFPHYTDTCTQEYQPSQDILQALQQAGHFALQHKHRITMHPGQYNVIGTPTAHVFEQTVKDLSMHAMILDAMNIPQNEGILCIHGGGVYGDKEATIRRWIEQFNDLPSPVKARISIENCEKSYSVDDCIEISEACNIPVIYDTHHYRCYCCLHQNEAHSDITELLPIVLEGWSRRGCNPLFHVSEPASLISTEQMCKHHDYVQEIPSELLHLPLLYDVNIDIEVEAKAKEAAIFRLYDTYSTIF